MKSSKCWNTAFSIYSLEADCCSGGWAPLSHRRVRTPLLTYLVSHRKVLAILGAPADSAVQTLVHVAVPFIRAVSTVISAVAEAPLRDAAAVGAHEEGAVAQAS